MVAKKGKDIARRPMSIVEARFDLSRRQNDIMDLLFSKFDEAPLEQTIFVLKIMDIKNLYQMDDKSHAYDFLYKAVKAFEGKGFRLKEDELSETWFSWFSKIKYIKGDTEENSRIELKIDSELKAILEQSRQNSYYKIEYSINLESKYSKRIYYYLVDRKNYQSFPGAKKGVFKVEVKELMEMLQCPKSFKYGNFKQKALDVAYRQINGSTDIEFEYEEIMGKGNKGQPTVVELLFKIKETIKRKEIVEDEISCTSEEIKEIINKLSCTMIEAQSIHNTAIKNERKWNEVEKIIDYTLQQNTENKVGYILSLLKNGFSEPQATVKKNKFNNFDGRKYSKKEIDDIEKSLLAKKKSMEVKND